MRILVTGGTGFIGYNLSRKLDKLGHEILITGTESENESNFFNIGKSFKEIKEENLKNIDVCFHQAANNDTLEKNQKKIFDENVYEPIELFEKLYKNRCKKFIFASSTAIYGNEKTPFSEDQIPKPLNFYAESKLEFEKVAMDFAKNKNINMIGLRYCNIYGPHEEHKKRRASMIYHICQDVMKGKNPKIFKFGEQKRDWCYVKDVVKANICCLDYNQNNIFNIASGKSINFNDLFKIIKNIFDVNVSIDYIDCQFKESYQNNTECDISKSKKELKWMPHYDVVSGIEDYFIYLSKNSSL